MPDWAAIRAAYIAGGMGQRALAQQYGVPYDTLAHRAAREKWTALRDAARAEATAAVVKRTGRSTATYDRRIYDIADRLLGKLDAALDAIDPADIASMRQAADILVKMQDIKGIRATLAREEAEARIAKLRREAERDERGDAETVIKVHMTGDVERLAE